jgi:3-oxoacyl-[acyl-carrier protein] reductase
MSKKLEGKIALVTGASKGIGAAIAKHLAAAGARVVVNYASSKADGEKVVAEITKAGGQAVAVQADVAKKADIVRLLGEVKKAHGKLDILVNNAGIFSPGAPLGQITEEHFHRLFDLNVLGVILVTQEALPLMGAGGSIINASKAAVDCLTRTFARELGPKNIRVNSVNPGLVETEGVNSAPHLKDRKDEVAKMNMLGRIGQPDDIAPIVVYLASDEASWTTGESFYVSGGMH